MNEITVGQSGTLEVHNHYRGRRPRTAKNGGKNGSNKRGSGMRTLENICTDSSFKNVSDLVKAGRPNAWKVICKSWSKKENWMKTTKALTVRGCGTLVQITTYEGPDPKHPAIADALQWIPGVKVVNDPVHAPNHPAGHMLVPISPLERLWMMIRSSFGYLRGY